MYYIANLESRKLLTYREGDRMLEANEDVARGKALRAQAMLGVSFAIVPITNTGNDALGREVAPWLMPQHHN